MNKFHAKAVTVDNLRFASLAEARRYGELKLLQRAGEIFDLKCQERFALEAWGRPICVYVGDFSYLTKTGSPVTEDVKGVRTPVYKLKAKLFRAQMGRAIVEVEA